MKTMFLLGWAMLLAALTLSGCGGSDSSPSVNAASGSNSALPSAPASSASRSATARVVALPVSQRATILNRLNDRGHASGYQPTMVEAIQLPVTVSATGVARASNANFFGGDEASWSLLRAASSNNGGMMAGYGIVNGNHLAWLWNGTPAVRLPVPSGYSIDTVVGPADTGSLAASTYNPATFEQEILLWQPNGSRSSIYRIIPVKAGMFLFGMASNGWIGGVERDGPMLTPKIYDGTWRPLPIDAGTCQCEAVRINARGQVLMTPRADTAGVARGYLVTTSGVTLLPRPDTGARYADLNDLGDVVGNATSGPFVILGGIVHELNAYAGSAALGWRFRTVVAINNQRQVLGVGQWQGQTRWFRLNLQ